MSVQPFLYRVPAGDQFFPIWARGRDALSAVSVSVSATFTNTQQIPLQIVHYAIEATGGAAQYPVKWFSRLLDPDNNVLTYFGGGEFSSTVAAQVNVAGPNAAVDILLPPRWKIQGSATFNAGAASNTSVLHVFGWYIPRGNLSL